MYLSNLSVVLIRSRPAFPLELCTLAADIYVNKPQYQGSIMTCAANHMVKVTRLIPFKYIEYISNYRTTGTIRHSNVCNYGHTLSVGMIRFA